jgi:hypothetical protein
MANSQEASLIVDVLEGDLECFVRGEGIGVDYIANLRW